VHPPHLFQHLTIMRYLSIPYPGGKARLAPFIVEALPQEGRLFVDPMVGRGNVFWAAASVLKYTKWWINDTQTAPFFNAIRAIGDSVRVPLRSHEEYTRQWDKFKRGDLRSILLEPQLTWGGGGYGTGGPGGKKGACAASYQATLRGCHRLMKITRVRVTALDLFKMGLETLTEEDTVFLDPPYFGADVRAYSNKFDHMGMIQLLRKAKFRWLLNEYRQDFYVKAFGEPFYTRDMQLIGTDFRRRNGGQARRTECMWKNY
jgi:site-specific DNA-adenine methylase